MPKNNYVWVLIFGLMVLMFLRLPPMVARKDWMLDTYRALVEADAIARQQYVEPITDERLVHGAIRGMMNRLDPYSGYIAPNELPDFERRSAGDYVGLGMELGVKGDQPVVIAPVEGGPAARAGLLAGDVLLTVNGRDAKGLSVMEVDELLGRDPSSPVRLLIERRSEDRPRELVIHPGPVHIHTVRGFRRQAGGEWDYMIDGDRGIAYVRISHFAANTMDDLHAVLVGLRDAQVRGLLLDLRFNPGGLLEQAVALVDRFVESGLIVSTVTRHKAVQEYRAAPDPADMGMELVVLVNGASASAAEIVAGALQDHGRALIVGERSFGKGSVQHLIYLHSNHSAIKLTTAHYRLPGGRIIHRTAHNLRQDSWGVQPDVIVPLSEEEVRSIQEARQRIDTGGGGPGTLRSEAEQSGAPNAHGGEIAGSTGVTEGEVLRDRQLATGLALLNERAAAAVDIP